MTSSRSMWSLMPRSLARSSSRSVSGVAARSAAHSSRSIVRNRLPGIGHPADPTLGPCPRCNPRLGERRRRGDYPTPHWLVDAVVEQAVTGDRAPAHEVTVLDPACGDGRFLVAAARRVRALGGRPVARRRRHRRRRPSPLRRCSDDRMRMQRSSAPTRSPRVGRGSASTSCSATRRSCRSSPRPRPRRGEPPRRRPVRRRRGRVPRPRRPSRAARRWARRPRRCRSRSSPRAMPVPCAPTSTAWPRSRGRGGRRRRSSTPRCSCARSSSSDAGRTSTGIDRPWTDIVTGRLGVPPLPALRPPGRSATAPA